MHWFLLILAIAFETVGTTALKVSDGFTRLVPSAITLTCFVTSLVLLSLVLRTVPVGVAYAIWSGLGIVLIAAIGWTAFDQRLDAPAIIGMALIVAGIVVMQVFSRTTG
ncbi:DMT family transporter [Jannaschia rubra]|uniref:Methyl viologen resistance protein C n=1 Tax=Jannaschia rubra TaxID=282197 RepID=A0A0M6XPX7_9RHOB|nr:SMR family transporter [Jannaschia rubra]CTQ32948.1 Methyl viologen resistance protein C [Jannaschia rubra]SFG26744.1 small multidrug resistance pump [Jannaschia rubra]